jgi:hypothetical protein
MPKNQLTEENEFSPAFQFVPGQHVYRQQGPYLVCRECALHHAVYIGMENVMVGEKEDGTPVIRKRSEL